MRYMTCLMMALLCAQVSAGQLVTVTQYSMDGVQAGGETEIWISRSYETQLTYKTQEVRYVSPMDKPFYVDISGLINAKNERQQLRALLNWGGIELSFEDGSASVKTKSSSDLGLGLVAVGTALPTGCADSYVPSCVDKIAVKSNQKQALDYSLIRIGLSENGKRVGIMKWVFQMPILLGRDVSDIDTTRGSWVASAHAYNYSYDNQEEWSGIVDPEGKVDFIGAYYGFDNTQANLKTAQKKSSNSGFYHTFNGSFSMQVGKYKVKSSGKAERLINDTYGADYEEGLGDQEGWAYGFDAQLGYMLVFSIGQNQLWGEVGFRYNALLEQMFSGPESEHFYSITSFGLTEFQGTYLTVGAVF